MQGVKAAGQAVILRTKLGFPLMIQMIQTILQPRTMVPSLVHGLSNPFGGILDILSAVTKRLWRQDVQTANPASP